MFLHPMCPQRHHFTLVGNWHFLLASTEKGGQNRSSLSMVEPWYVPTLKGDL